ncbi:MAG: SWIM zinc finger family protein [Clostridia bacterium]|nr:SWIM zinc finger family protein [Clostridia bacterium]
MGLVNMASGASLWRGYEYYQDKKVQAIEPINETQFRGSVDGSQDQPYDVLIDIEHPRKSHCNCPHADGRWIICKHMIALYFTVFPKEAENYYKEMIAYEEKQDRLRLESEQIAQEQDRSLAACIEKMSKQELQEALVRLLDEGPEWQYNRFIDIYLDRTSETEGYYE